MGLAAGMLLLLDRGRRCPRRLRLALRARGVRFLGDASGDMSADSWLAKLDRRLTLLLRRSRSSAPTWESGMALPRLLRRLRVRTSNAVLPVRPGDIAPAPASLASPRCSSDVTFVLVGSDRRRPGVESSLPSPPPALSLGMGLAVPSPCATRYRPAAKFILWPTARWHSIIKNAARSRPHRTHRVPWVSEENTSSLPHKTATSTYDTRPSRTVPW